MAVPTPNEIIKPSRPYSLWVWVLIVLFSIAAVYIVARAYSADRLQKIADEENSLVTADSVITTLPVEKILNEQVAEQNRTGYDEYASQLDVTAQYYPEPPAPIQLEARTTSTGTSVVVSWDIPFEQSIDAVEVYRGAKENAKPTLVDTVVTPLESYADYTVTPGNTYYYSVRSVRDIESKEYTSERTKAVVIQVEDVLAPAPPVVTSVEPDVSDPTAILVNWEPSADDIDIEEFRVYRSQTYGQIGNLVAEVKATVNQVSDSTGEAGTTYYYTVTAVDAAGNESSTRLPHGLRGNSEPFIYAN